MLESKAAAIQHVHQYLVAGYDPREDEDISVIYYALVDEFGENLFAAEMNQLSGYVLTKEEERYKYN